MLFNWKNFGTVEGVGINGGADNRGGIFICATELAKFGQLFLNKGKWNNHQIISEEWIKMATSPQIENIIFQIIQ